MTSHPQKKATQPYARCLSCNKPMIGILKPFLGMEPPRKFHTECNPDRKKVK